MNRVLPLLAFAALTACASATSSAVAPAPVPEVAAVPVPAIGDTAAVGATAPAVRAPAATRDVAPVVRSPADPAPRDDTLGVTFLDSLRALGSDAATSVRVSVAREDVREEAAQLFGQPEGATWDIDVVTYAEHERVQYWMDYFTGRSRWHFERYLERLGRYDSMIRTRLGEAGLPRDMIYLAMIESGFNQNAVSRAGAVGLWQFMPATGRLYGLEFSAWVDDRRDPYKATDAAIRFLSDLNDRFGSLYLAAAAYNGGPGRVQRGLRRGEFDGIANRDDVFFAMAQDSRTFRRETRDYVPKLIAAALLAKEPERYGFTHLEPWAPQVYDSTVVDFQVGFDVVARLAGTTRDVIEDLNPRFHRGVTPPDRRVWLKLPAGTADSVAARLADLPPSERVTLLVHFVSRGETLSSLSRRYGVSVADIRSANQLASNRIVRGQRLVIPTTRARRTAGTTARTAPSAGATRSASRATTARPSAAGSGTTTRAATSRRMHVVREGETLGGIAERFQVPLSSLLRANGLTSRSVIRAGQTLRVP